MWPKKRLGRLEARFPVSYTVIPADHDPDPTTWAEAIEDARAIPRKLTPGVVLYSILGTSRKHSNGAIDENFSPLGESCTNSTEQETRYI